MTNRNWTRNRFYNDVLMNSNTKTSGRSNTTPIDVNNRYYVKDVDIDDLCDKGSDIMNFIESSGNTGLDLQLNMDAIQWDFRIRRNFTVKCIFGIHIHTKKPRLMVFKYVESFLKNYYPNIDYSNPYLQHGSGMLVFNSDIMFKDVEHAFYECINYSNEYL